MIFKTKIFLKFFANILKTFNMAHALLFVIVLLCYILYFTCRWCAKHIFYPR